MNKIVASLLESVSDELQQGEEVYLKGFGRFELKVRKAHIHIPEKVSVAFTISRKFKAEDGVIEKIRPSFQIK